MKKSGKVVLVGFVLVTAIASGLVGFWFGAYQDVSIMGTVPATMVIPAGEPVRGSPVALAVQKQVRLYAGPNLKAPVAYTVEGDKVWIGDNTANPPGYMLENDRLMRSPGNEIQYTLAGNRIYRGSDTNSGSAVYTIVEYRVFQGDNATGEALLTFVGNHVHWGGNAAGPTILTANADIEGNPTLEFLLPVLLLERF